MKTATLYGEKWSEYCLAAAGSGFVGSPVVHASVKYGHCLSASECGGDSDECDKAADVPRKGGVSDIDRNT